MDIAFGILSSWEPPAAVGQLVNALGTQDSIFVHHDYSKQPDFALPGLPVWLLPDFVQTGWGSPEFVRAIFHLIRTGLKRSNFDYFQLLSGSCLPLRTVPEMKLHLAANPNPILADIIDMDSDDHVLMSHGHRVLSPDNTLSSRALGRARQWYLGSNPTTFHQANLGIRRRSESKTRLGLNQWMGRQIHVAARAGYLGGHPFKGTIRPYVGSIWFCLRRDICEWLVSQEASNPLMPYLLSLKLCDEIVFPTLLGNSGHEIKPSNHLVNRFDDSHPRFFSEADVPGLRASQKFFARKFRPDADDETRALLLNSSGVPAGVTCRLRAMEQASSGILTATNGSARV